MSNLLDILKEDKDFENWAKGKTWDDIFFNCPKGEWLLWLFQKTNPEDIKLLTLAKGRCANTMRYFMLHERTRQAIDIAIKFGTGKTSLNELNSIVKISSDLAASYFSEFKKIEKGYNELDFNSELFLYSSIESVSIDSINGQMGLNSIFYNLSEIGRIAVDIHAPAYHIAQYTSECIYEIADYEPLELLRGYRPTHNVQEPSMAAGFPSMYSSYINNTLATSINDTPEMAKEKNQLATADICRSLFPLPIWNIS